MSSRKKIMITLIIILLLLTAGVYGYGVYYFTEHFLPGSMVNGFNCSYMTVSQSEELLTQKVGAYVLTIDTRNNGQESITAKQAGLSYDSDGSVDKLIRNQDRFTVPAYSEPSQTVYRTGRSVFRSSDIRHLCRLQMKTVRYM